MSDNIPFFVEVIKLQELLEVSVKENTQKWQIFSSSTLKVVACLLMLIDHVGAEIFTRVEVLRIVGRLAYPVFAYLIAEGCKYTKNKFRYFINIFLLGVFCEGVYISFSGEYYGNILLTFSLSVLMIYAMQNVKEAYAYERATSIAVFALSVILTYIISSTIGVDYGFWGAVTPLFPAVCDHVKLPERVNALTVKAVAFFIGLLLVAADIGGNQWWSLGAIILLFMYNGKRGNNKLKYVFYMFYPAHLALIGIISMLIKNA